MRAPTVFGPIPARVHLRRAVVQDLPLKAAAAGVALLLWAAAAQAAPREVVAVFDGRIAVERPEVREGYVLRAQLGDVAVRLRGASDAIARIGHEHLRATVDLSSVDPGAAEAQEAPVRVTISDERVTIVDVAPASLPVRLERVTTRALAVQVRYANEPPRGTTAGGAMANPAEVRVTGPESASAAVAALFATVRFGDVPVDLVQSAQVSAVDRDGRAVEGVQMEPAAVQVSVPVLPTSSTRTLPVLWTVRGAVAPGYWISRVVTDPAAVTVRGDPAAVGALERVEAAPVDVSGLTANRTVRVALNVPSAVALLQPVEASVTVTVSPLSGTRPFPMVAIQTTGLPPDLTADVEPHTIEVVLGGPVPLLMGLGLSAVTVVVDAGGRGPGTYQLDADVRAQNGTTVEAVRPSQVTLTVRPR